MLGENSGGNLIRLRIAPTTFNLLYKGMYFVRFIIW